MNPIEEFNDKQARLIAKLQSQVDVIAYLLALYPVATQHQDESTTPEDSKAKWEANGLLMGWARNSLPQILELWASANAEILKPGGRARQRLARAVKKMPLPETKGGAA